MSPVEWENYFRNHGFRVQTKIGYGKKWSCVLNELTVPLSLLGFVHKKIFNRWTLSEKVRGYYSMPAKLFFMKCHADFRENPSKSGLIYFELTKN